MSTKLKTHLFTHVAAISNEYSIPPKGAFFHLKAHPSIYLVCVIDTDRV